jgi:hypothetical protein
MIKIGDEFYYLDLDRLSEVLYPENQDEELKEGITIEKDIEYFQDTLDDEKRELKVTERHRDKPREVDGLKYELVRAMLDVLMNVELEYNEVTESPADLEKAPTNFIISFNTLLKLKIIKII